MKQRLRQSRIAAVLTAVAASLAGCFDITKDATFREDGGVSMVVEIALAPELAAILGNPALSKQFEQEGTPNFLSECGKPLSSDQPLPEGVRSVESVRGKRGEMETCTLVIDVSDPVVAVARANEMQPPPGQKIPRQDVSLTRLDGRPGYRFRASLTAPRIPGPPGAGDTRAMGKAVLDALFANRFVSVGLTGQRIENTNGELALDGRRVTWRLSIADMLDPARGQPITFEADILYK
jgi:hypothetical protein